jgi:carbonic anhydrase/acetyltransferase-like protein (isoleucine patch superfamily)
MRANVHREARLPIESFENHLPDVHASAFVHPGAYVLGEVTIAEEASIWPATVLRGDHGAIHVGPRTSVQDGSVAHATEGKSVVRVGAECTVGHRVVLHGCVVGDHCLVGMGSVLLDGAELGEWCFLAAGSLVTPGKRFEPRSFILGSPARRVREVTAKELEWIVYSARAYQDLAVRHRR